MTMAPACLVDGRPADSVPVDDRGLQYGDGVFETIAVRGGRVRALDAHLTRLADGCARLAIAAPDPAALRSEIARLADGAPDCVIKVIVTRGSGGRGYRPADGAVARRVVARHPLPGQPPGWSRDGVAVRWCDTRLGIQPALAGIKHLNRIEQVLARAEWHDMDRWQEGLMCDTGGNVIEATQANLFVVHDGMLSTPDLGGCGVAGVTRASLLAAADAHGIACRVRKLSRGDIESADEMFLCNSVIDIWPVRSLGERVFARAVDRTRARVAGDMADPRRLVGWLLALVVVAATLAAWEWHRVLSQTLAVPPEGMTIDLRTGDTLLGVTERLAERGILDAPRRLVLAAQRARVGHPGG